MNQYSSSVATNSGYQAFYTSVVASVQSTIHSATAPAHAKALIHVDGYYRKLDESRNVLQDDFKDDPVIKCKHCDWIGTGKFMLAVDQSEESTLWCPKCKHCQWGFVPGSDVDSTLPTMGGVSEEAAVVVAERRIRDRNRKREKTQRKKELAKRRKKWALHDLSNW